MSQLTKGVDHVGVVVQDVDRALSEFRDLLGLELVHDEILEHKGLRLAYLAAGNVEIQLVAPVASKGFIHEHLQRYGEGLHHICLNVDELGSALDQTKDNSSGIFKGGKGRRVCFLTSRPGGALIELIEPEARVHAREE